MTPRQIAAYTFLGARRREQEFAALLGVVALGAQGEGDDVNKQIDKWVYPR